MLGGTTPAVAAKDASMAVTSVVYEDAQGAVAALSPLLASGAFSDIVVKGTD